MTNTFVEHSLETCARRGQEIFERKVASIRANLPDDFSVAIDLGSESVEIAPDWHVAVSRLQERDPNAQIWVRKIGSRRLTRLISRSANLQSDLPILRGMKPIYPPHEFGTRGDEIFHRVVAKQVRHLSPEAFVAIDIDSEDFEVGDDSLDVNKRLLARRPMAQIWGRRIGSSSTYHLGGRLAVSGSGVAEAGGSSCLAE